MVGTECVNKTLVSFLGCDDRTVIRNLLILEEKGIIKRVYGGYLDDTRTVIRLTVA
jgi:DeoR/GlpR family transcriptional regulator of sugar metabolism